MALMTEIFLNIQKPNPKFFQRWNHSVKVVNLKIDRN